MARPSGAWIIEDGHATWRPAIDVNRVILGGQLVALTAIVVTGRVLLAHSRRRHSLLELASDLRALRQLQRPARYLPRSATEPSGRYNRSAGPYDRRVVGIALLTLVPGELGGSETYARELLRALARGGELDYRVLLPPVAPDGAGGLPAEVATEYLEARTLPKRLAAMTLATARPGPLRRAARRRGRRALPADAADPARREADGRVAARPAAPRPAGALLARRSARSARSRGTARCAAPTA